ncbi:hypothetical protein QJS10_CPB20g00969 [Acorus calamus]|uniref:DRBM domain-containing protein n=1 Tax=Acorus calamus TaxID=4465 RepID=A0AAV9CBR2_ACOCL|nr:hypothetical protein QJS10_CPB20g00969 [Acorus calamus]
MNIAHVFAEVELSGIGSNKNKKTSQLIASKDALEKFSNLVQNPPLSSSTSTAATTFGKIDKKPESILAIVKMATSVMEVEEILKYEFKKSLLEEALTHALLSL